eukprot:2781648-Pyramimonas_sp.AAC.1
MLSASGAIAKAIFQGENQAGTGRRRLDSGGKRDTTCTGKDGVRQAGQNTCQSSLVLKKVSGALCECSWGSTQSSAQRPRGSRQMFPQKFFAAE